MKIVTAADLGPQKIGSIEDLLFQTTRRLEERGAENLLVFSGEPSPDVREYFGLPGKSRISALGTPSDAGRISAWSEHLAALKGDVYWLHFIPAIGPLIPALRRACPNARIVLHDHISRGVAARSPLKQAYCRFRAPRYNAHIDCFIAVSEFVANRLRVSDFVPAQKVVTIANAVDLKRFQPARTPGSGFLCVAYLRPEKGVRVLLQAVALLRERGITAPVRIAGRGPCLEEYRQMAAEQGLAHVEFLGERSDIPRLLQEAQALLVPSQWPEAFGLVAAEAQASGRPVIASRIGGLPEVVEEGRTGLLVPPGDAKALADAMAALATDPPRAARMGEAGRQRAEASFNLDAAVEQYVRALLPKSGPLS